MIDWRTLRREALLSSSESMTLPDRLQIPALPEVVLRFAQKADEPEATPADLAKIIETDSGLTSQLLKLVNSAAMGIGRKVNCVQLAINLLGIRRSKYLLLSVTVERSMKSREWALIHSHNFWTSNLERAILAREVAHLLHADAELAFAAGLLTDILLPVLTTEYFDLYAEFARPGQSQAHDLPAFEIAGLGWNHAAAAARIMSQWGFPDDLICCVAYHHHGMELLEHEQLGRTAAAATAIASLAPDSFRQVPDGLRQLIRLEERWPAFQLLPIAERVHTQFQELASGNDSHYPLLKRVQKALEHATA